jgi:hypothetical protein
LPRGQWRWLRGWRSVARQEIRGSRSNGLGGLLGAPGRVRTAGPCRSGGIGRTPAGRGWERRLGEQVSACDAESQAPSVPVPAERACGGVLTRAGRRALGTRFVLGRFGMPREVHLRCWRSLRYERGHLRRLQPLRERSRPWGAPLLRVAERHNAGDRGCRCHACCEPLTALLAEDQVRWVVPAAGGAIHAKGWDNVRQGTVKVCPLGPAARIEMVAGPVRRQKGALLERVLGF